MRGHRLADRLELLPDGYGEAGPVDENDPEAVIAEWARCLRQWASDSPEQVFALKVGGGLLAAAVLALWALVGVFH